MAKATLTLTTGAVVTIEGTPEEVHSLLALHASSTGPVAPQPKSKPMRSRGNGKQSRASNTGIAPAADMAAGLASVIQGDSSWSTIENRILNLPGQAARILLCCNFALEHVPAPWLSARDIERATDELGARIGATNVSKTIREQMRRYVVVDNTQAVSRFKINRRGIDAYRALLKSIP